MILIYLMVGVFAAIILITALRFSQAVLKSYFGELWAVVRHGKGEPEEPRGNQPAFLAYPFEQAWVDYRTVVSRSYERSVEDSSRRSENARDADGGDGCLYFAGALVGIFIGWLFGAVTFLTFSAIHLVIVGFCCAVAVALAYLFRLVEYAGMLWRGIFLVHIPLIGGPTTGKSTLMVAAMAELTQRAAAGQVHLEFPQARDARTFQAAAAAFARGELLAKTADYTAPAFLAKLTDSQGASALLYVYDAAGELYAGSSQLSGQQFFLHVNGLMLLVDPYSLSRVRDAAALDIGAATQSWSTEPPDAVLNRVLDVFRGFSGQSGRVAQPLAVVLTKIDTPFLSALQTKEGADAAATSQTIRSWVEAQGEGNLVRTIDREFKHVRYFSCSALGRVPDGRPAPFVPRGVLAPLAWLLQPNGMHLEKPSAVTHGSKPGQPENTEL